MVKVIMGVKGSGKTKLLIDLVRKALDEERVMSS
jgi:Ni2+-binding GTPase involved in maturation of urease and hydrogenase